jgi:outer membrane protein TolC
MLSLFWAWSLTAQTSAPPLTWDDCVRELIETNPELSAAREAVEKARTDVKGAYGPFLPQVSANASANKSNTELDTGYQDSTAYNANLTASQSLFSGFHDIATLRQYQALFNAAEMTFQTVKSTLSYNLTQAFAKLQYAQDFLKMADLIASRRKENLNLVEMRFNAGRENKGSFLRSKAYFRQAQFDVTQAKRGILTAQQQLAAAMGRSETARLTVTGRWDVGNIPAPPDYQELAKQTPDYRQAAAKAVAAREGVRIAASGFYPEWSVSGMVGRQDDDSIIPNNEQWSVGTTISWPLFTGGQTYYALRGAQASRRAAEATVVNTANQAIANLEDKFTAWQDAAERTEVQAEFLRAAEVRSEIARGQYQNGLLSFEDWDLIENDLIDKQKAFLTSQRDAVIAKAAWEKAVGTGVIP